VQGLQLIWGWPCGALIPLQAAAQTLDALVKHLPPETTMPLLLSEVQRLGASSAASDRKAAMIALSVRLTHAVTHTCIHAHRHKPTCANAYEHTHTPTHTIPFPYMHTHAACANLMGGACGGR
jgi:hypothetical protein